jgi:hypothetical protein
MRQLSSGARNCSLPENHPRVRIDRGGHPDGRLELLDHNYTEPKSGFVDLPVLRFSQGLHFFRYSLLTRDE